VMSADLAPQEMYRCLLSGIVAALGLPHPSGTQTLEALLYSPEDEWATNVSLNLMALLVLYRVHVPIENMSAEARVKARIEAIRSKIAEMYWSGK